MPLAGRVPFKLSDETIDSDQTAIDKLPPISSFLVRRPPSASFDPPGPPFGVLWKFAPKAAVMGARRLGGKAPIRSSVDMRG